jgi:hypothetical protein
MTKRIIFQDIDGPLIPLRLFYRGGRPFNQEVRSFIYDPVAVDMIRHLCEKFSAKMVFNSAHCENPHDVMAHQARFNGLGDVLHEDCKTEFISKIDNRFEAIKEWLSRHPEATEWIVIDDAEVHPLRQVKVNYNIGMTLEDYVHASRLFGEEIGHIVKVQYPDFIGQNKS